MLIDQLRVTVTPQEDTEIVKPRHNALQFDAIDQEYGEGRFLLPDVIEKCVLQALGFFGGHFAVPLLVLLLKLG
jgi:hypothetical protein